MPTKTNRPFPLGFEVEFRDRLHEPVREGKAASVSAIIRTALARYDFEKVIVMHAPQLQISVRLPLEIRKNLKKLARTKHTSISHLVRAAVEAYLPSLEAPLLTKRQIARRKPARKPRRKG